MARRVAGAVVVGGHTTVARGGNDAGRRCADDAIMNATHVDPVAIAEQLTAAASGRTGALDELIRLCAPFVECNARKYAWSNTDPDDIVQEVWIQLIEHIDRIREPEALLGWLQVVTRRLAGHMGRRFDRVRPTEIDEFASTSSTEEQALAHQESEQVTVAIQAALARLSDADRGLLMLLNSDAEPRHYCEISRIVQRPVGSLGPTRRRLLNRLSHDPAVRHLQISPS